ncbi:MAG: heme exporter protein CcmB [Bdellovibrionales bacterium]|nr:heme exporter protein CcmB [Bdellovibrionales bacterium]
MNAFVWLVEKDLRCLHRAKHVVVSTLGFALLLEVTAGFAFRQVGYGQIELLEVTPGILWLIFLFAAVIALNHSFLFEHENEPMTGLLLTAADPGTVYLAKCLSNFLLVGTMQVFTIGAHALLFGADLSGKILPLCAVSLLSALGLCAAGTLLAAIAVCTRGRELVLPLTLYPLLIPLVAGSVYLMREVIFEQTIDWGGFWFLTVLGFDVVALVLCWVLFEYVVRE